MEPDSDFDDDYGGDPEWSSLSRGKKKEEEEDEDEEIDVPRDEDVEDDLGVVEENDHNSDQAYQENNDQQQQKQLGPPTGKRRKKKDLSNLQGTKLLKILAASRYVTEITRDGQKIARLQFEEEKKQKHDDNDEKRKNQSFSNKRQRYGPSSDMTAPVGYTVTDVGKEDGVDTFELRMTKAAQNEVFDIERRVNMKANRFMPIGTSCFFSRTNEFYSKPTDLVCLWCTEPFDTPPIPSPVKYKVKKAADDQAVFFVEGQFCSFNCLLAHHRKERPSLSMARLMMKLVYGVPMSRCVEEAPVPTALKKFGGIYSIEEFRATSASGIKTEQIKLPFFPFLSGITEVESIETIIREQGGKELATRRLRGGALGNIAPVISNFATGGDDTNAPSTRRLQKGRFATSLSIKEQIDLSDRRYRLQRQGVEEESKKRMTLVHFMRKKPVGGQAGND